MNTMKRRLAKLENEMLSQKPGWVWEVEQLVKRGLFTPHDVLVDIGNTALQTWPEWYRPITDEHYRIAKEADQKFDAEMVEKLGGQKQYNDLLDRIHNCDITDEEIWALIA